MAYLDLMQEDPNKNKRTGIIIFLVCMAIFMLMCAVTCNGQVYKAVDIPKILGRTDSISKLELLTAKKFHNKINEYRAHKNIPPLIWSDTLYIIAMNHSAWMALNKTRLTHLQWDMTYDFTGIKPTNRAEYVCEERIWWIGENLAWFGYSKGTVEEMAETSALTAFNMLKNDPPHNAPMVDRSNTKHAAYFSYNGGRCASEFCGNKFIRKE